MSPLVKMMQKATHSTICHLCSGESQCCLQNAQMRRVKRATENEPHHLADAGLFAVIT
jgi:hypothetical protein